jgi:hypothetical protein
MVLDETDMLAGHVHAQIEANFWLQVYASHQPINQEVLDAGTFFPGPPRVKRINIG